VYGEIAGSRIDYEFPADPNVIEVPNAKNAKEVSQIAILIKAHRGESSHLLKLLKKCEGSKARRE
jgi:hypothetical protein